MKPFPLPSNLFFCLLFSTLASLKVSSSLLSAALLTPNFFESPVFLPSLPCHHGAKQVQKQTCMLWAISAAVGFLIKQELDKSVMTSLMTNDSGSNLAVGPVVCQGANCSRACQICQLCTLYFMSLKSRVYLSSPPALFSDFVSSGSLCLTAMPCHIADAYRIASHGIMLCSAQHSR